VRWSFDRGDAIASRELPAASDECKRYRSDVQSKLCSPKTAVSLRADLLPSLQLFVRIAHAGSFSVAGRELGIPQSSTSRLISALEEEVGAALLSRTTRAVVLTDVGRDYLARVEPVLRALAEANLAARGSGELRGVLRVGVPSWLATRIVIPTLSAFYERHTALRVEFVMDVKWHDLIREAIDVALCVGPMADSTSTARRIFSAKRILAASPYYLRRAGIPTSPAELANHSIVLGSHGLNPHAWSFEQDERAVSIRVSGHFTSTGNDGATAAAAAGLGIISTLECACAAELISGELEPVLSDWRMPFEDVNAVFPGGRRAAPPARAFVAHVVEHMADPILRAAA
jgi:DNA-binding transcriptional LysR family regulator